MFVGLRLLSVEMSVCLSNFRFGVVGFLLKDLVKFNIDN